MNKIIILLLILSLFGCGLSKYKYEEPPCDIPVNQIFEYNPQKAGAEIEATIGIDEVDYINYQNNSFYSICRDTTSDKVGFFDITNDVVINKNEFIIEKSNFDERYSYISTKNVNVINGKIILFATLTDNSTDKTFNSLIKFDENNNTMSFYDNTKDFVQLDSFNDFYYDVNTSYAYAINKVSYRELNLFKYSFDSIRYNLLNSVNFKSEDYYLRFTLTQNAIMNYLYWRRMNRDTDNFLDICLNYQKESRKKVNLTFLNLKNKAEFVFCDGNNVWLCVYEYDNKSDDKYFLLKVKLLDVEASENEYLEKDDYQGEYLKPDCWWRR